MDSSYHATESPTAARSEVDDLVSGTLPNDDQCFLMYNIMGTYFGPNLKGDRTQKSALQRINEGLPQCTSNQLAGSHMKTVEVERVYYHVLRKADQSLAVKLPLLHQFFQGNLPVPRQESNAVYPQFPYLFPPQLHPHSRSNGYKVIENIVFINNPEVDHMKPEDRERFKRLTGLKDFLLNRDSARMYTSAVGGGLYNVTVQEETNGDMPSFKTLDGPRKTRRLDDIMDSKGPHHDVHVVTPISSVSHNGIPMIFSFLTPSPAEAGTRPMTEFGPAMIYLPSHPTMQEWENIVAATRSGFALTGSAAKGQVGPIIGHMDIGESDDSYIFRVSLPGVKRDEREFSCEVDNDGKVLIRGVTATGEKRVYRHSQLFEMQTQNLCPPGNFSMSFQLPGPVDPRKFSGNFGTDGILEGTVMKDTQRKR